MLDTQERQANGVRRRKAGTGDAWANMHREQLGAEHLMQDIDGLFGMTAFGYNTGNRLFFEYIPDDYENRQSKIRRFAVVALFDRKISKDAAFHERSTLSTAFHMHLCRLIGTQQPIPPKFFYVIGRDDPPWLIVELDIDTGDVVKETILDGNWREIWDHVGLISIRNSLKNWILN